MTKYSELYSNERSKNARLRQELERVREQRDKYLAFIRDGFQSEFMRWTAIKLGISLAEYDSLCVKQPDSHEQKGNDHADQAK